MHINAYLSFKGQCEAAFKFYEQCLGGKITFRMTYAGMPPEYPVAPEWREKIMHATLTVGSQTLMGADAPPDCAVKPQGFHVSLGIADAAEAERIFAALAENGMVEMPLQETFWAIRFGMVIDRFGTPWMINCGKPA